MSDDFDAFKQGVVDQSLANALYDAVRKGMGLTERELTKGEEKEKERIVKGMKKAKGGFKKRYGKDADAVMYATATKLAKNESQLNEIAPAIAGAIWVLNWVAVRGAWPLLKWLLKKHGGKILAGGAGVYYIDKGWDWVTSVIGEEMAQMLIDNKFTIAMAVALIIGGVMIQKYFTKQGEKLVKANEQLIANGY